MHILGLIMGWIRLIMDKCSDAGVEAAMCGDLASDLKFTSKLLDSGLTNFSVIPTVIPMLREHILDLVTKMEKADG